MSFRLASLALASLGLVSPMVHAAAPKPPAHPSKVQLAAVIKPVGEALIAAPADAAPAPVPAPPIRVVPAGTKRALTIVESDGTPFLTATKDGKPAWTVQDFPSAGGTGAGAWTHDGWNVLFAWQSRTGTILFDLANGKRVGGGYLSAVMAPDGSWALLAPWFNDWSNCLEGGNVERIALTHGRPALHHVPSTEVPHAERCIATGPDNHLDLTTVRAAISPSGEFYAVARFARLDEKNAFSQVAGRIELFRAKGDVKLATLDTKFPVYFDRLAFSASGNYLVLSAPKMAGGFPAEEQWIQVTR